MEILLCWRYHAVITSGLKIKIVSGARWSILSVVLRGVLLIGLKMVEGWPCCVAEKRWRE